jgi:hypothetical protein
VVDEARLGVTSSGSDPADTRAGVVRLSQADHALNAVFIVVLGAAGVTSLTWLTSPIALLFVIGLVYEIVRTVDPGEIRWDDDGLRVVRRYPPRRSYRWVDLGPTVRQRMAGLVFIDVQQPVELASRVRALLRLRPNTPLPRIRQGEADKLVRVISVRVVRDRGAFRPDSWPPQGRSGGGPAGVREPRHPNGPAPRGSAAAEPPDS